MRQHPLGYANHPIWIAFELWADQHGVSNDPEDWTVWWECFLVGYEVGEAEAAS